MRLSYHGWRRGTLKPGKLLRGERGASLKSAAKMPKGLRGEKRPADVIGMRTQERDPWKSVAAKLGARGGKARAARMTPERRSEIARRAAESRWRQK